MVISSVCHPVAVKNSQSGEKVVCVRRSEVLIFTTTSQLVCPSLWHSRSYRQWTLSLHTRIKLRVCVCVCSSWSSRMCEKLCVSNVCLGVVDECVLRYFPPAAHYFTHSSIHAPLKCSGELIHLHTHTDNESDVTALECTFTYLTSHL